MIQGRQIPRRTQRIEMIRTASQSALWDASLPAATEGRRLQRSSIPMKTTRTEGVLLFATVSLLPLQDQIPSVAGFSFMYLIFALLGLYILANRARYLTRTWTNPLFLSGYLFIFIASFIEFLHPEPTLLYIKRVTAMIGGAVLVAVLCRDRKALQSCLYGYIASGIWISVLLFLTFYGLLQQSSSKNFQQATRVRIEAEEQNPLNADLNAMSATAAKAVVVLFVFVLLSKSPARRNLLLVAAAFCLVGTFLPMSRGGMVNVAFSAAVVLAASRAVRVRAVLGCSALALAVILWVPDVALSRLDFSPKLEAGPEEGRTRIYKAVMETASEFWFGGVGSGNFFHSWGRDNGFGDSGAHNCFFQVTINWGILGLLSFSFLFWQAYRCLPKRCDRDALSLALLGTVASVFIVSLVVHEIYSKELTLAFGMLAGSRRWIWPKGVVESGRP